MSRTQMTKTFDCIAFKRHVQSEIYEKIEDMTAEERREYFRVEAESGDLGDWWKAVKSRPEGMATSPSSQLSSPASSS
jgi:hypothetical protein